MAFCTFCGTQLPDGATSCPSCGHPTGAPVAANVIVPVPSVGATDGYAIASVVCAIAAFIFIPVLGSILGVIFGRMSQSRIAASPGLGGAGLARAGVIIGWVGIGLTIGVFLIFVLLLAAFSSFTF